jgi:hypothetical protein
MRTLHPKTFTEVSRGRWELGRPAGYEPALLSPIEVADYLERRHKNTPKTRPTTSGSSAIDDAA